MSDDLRRGYPGEDPFVDQSDPEAVERAERRREREEKRASKAAKKKQKEAAAPPSPPPPKEEPPTKPRTPEQEFWDEPAEPVPPPPGQGPGSGGAPKPDPEAAERGRRRLLGRRKKNAAVAGGAAAGAAGAAAVADDAGAGGAAPGGTASGKGAKGAPPSADAPVVKAPPPTPERPTAEQPEPPSGEGPIPPQTEALDRPASERPQSDPGPGTAESPRPDPTQPTGEHPSAARGRRVPPPRPMEETGAGDWEPPPPRDEWFDDADDLHDEGDPRMAGAARTGRRHGDDGGRRGGIFGALLRHPFRILGVIVLIVILLFLNALFQPFHGGGHGKVAVVIPKGSSVGEVGDLLEKKGVISGGFIVPGSTLFQARVTLAGKRSDLFAGRFVMAKDMSYGEVIDQLSEEPKPQEETKPGIVTVTIPEGQSRPITAKLLKEDGIKGNYMQATKKSKYLDPEQYGGKNVKDLEGFLFPDTWEFKTKLPISYLVRLQLEDFKQKIKKVNMKYAKSKNLTVFDVVTIASMVEREAGVPKQRKLVASVIYNRLHEGMTLGIDSTIRFATGNYEEPLTQSELESESPYNTRTHGGLPPGPINSPGLAAMQAAAHPAKTDYLFYVNNPNSCNELTFAKTEEEFLADAAKYEKAREANGGNQPSTCK
ncbi:MAG: endolytic transglycosylase MltG [Actinobacteria bacterium]|nr:endolytic transglycosylase MltG [Actinomycetota bacterium]